MKGFFNEFKEFAVKGSVIDLAVGLIIGTAFNKVVSSLVSDIMLPPIGLLLKRVDFSSMYASLDGGSYSSLAAAQSAGAPTLNYGLFINSIISFVITALAVFLVVKWINRLRRKGEKKETKEAAATTKECPFCATSIPIKASRCPACTSDLAKA